MSHERKKKGGERKDHKMERMREAIEERKAHASPPRPTNDQQDLQTFKPGSHSDRARDPHNIPKDSGHV